MKITLYDVREQKGEKWESIIDGWKETEHDACKVVEIQSESATFRVVRLTCEVVQEEVVEEYPALK